MQWGLFSIFNNENNIVEKKLIKKQIKNFEKDLRFGYTTVGPHRDDVKFLINGEEKIIVDMFEIYISEKCFDKKLKESRETLKKFLGGTEDAKKEKNTNRRGKNKNKID